MLLAQFMSVAFFGIAFVTTGVVPGLNAIGLIGHNSTYTNWANDISTGKGWQFALGTLVVVAASAMFIGGWRWTLRTQNVIFLFTLLGVVVATVIALFSSKSGFMSDFNLLRQAIYARLRYLQQRHRGSYQGRRRSQSVLLALEYLAGRGGARGLLDLHVFLVVHRWRAAPGALGRGPPAGWRLRVSSTSSASSCA